MDIGGNMKKILMYIIYILCLFLISIMPTSAKEIKMCVRSENDLHVRDSLINNNNLQDIYATPCVDDTQKVYDFADLLTDEEEENIYNEIENFIEKTDYDLVVVTINENPKNDAMAYADDFYDYNAFGKNATRDGVLLLIDMQNREIYISTTGYAIKMYDDERLGINEEYYNTNSVLDYGYDYVTKEEYYNAFSAMIKRLTEFYNLGYPQSNINIEINDIGKPVIVKYMNYPFMGFLAAIITLIVSLIIYNKSRLKIKVGSTISYLQNKDINLKKDHLVNSVVTHHIRNTDSGSGGSSSGHVGGSSYHSSSSGSFHGGGGRHF